MSRVSQNDIKSNPAQKFLSWKTLKKEIDVEGEMVQKIDKGTFVYYDKETEKNIPLSIPFKFALINNDDTTFKGYDEKKKIGYYSNEVRDKDHKVVIRSKEGKVMEFNLEDYKANKDALSGMGIKYTKPVYVAVETDDAYELQCLVLNGAPLTGAVDMQKKNPDEAQDGWFSFTRVNKNKLYTNWIEVTGYKLKKKGETRFTIPVYKIGDPITKEEGKTLDELDNELKDYLDYYFAKKEEPAKKDATTTEEHDAYVPEGADDDENASY